MPVLTIVFIQFRLAQRVTLQLLLSPGWVREAEVRSFSTQTQLKIKLLQFLPLKVQLDQYPYITDYIPHISCVSPHTYHYQPCKLWSITAIMGTPECEPRPGEGGSFGLGLLMAGRIQCARVLGVFDLGWSVVMFDNEYW